jgi:tRNA threonylcarbamoyladenosine biosynthesis protein TsaE
MKEVNIITNSSIQTKKIVAKKAFDFIVDKLKKNKKRKKAVILFLKGGLGAGKTTFLQGFAKMVGVKEKVLSPTFILIRKMPIKKNFLNFKNFYHIDFYRLSSKKDLNSLKLKEVLSNPTSLVAIEWPEKFAIFLPKPFIVLDFKILGKNKRLVTFKTF